MDNKSNNKTNALKKLIKECVREVLKEELTNVVMITEAYKNTAQNHVPQQPYSMQSTRPVIPDRIVNQLSTSFNPPKQEDSDVMNIFTEVLKDSGSSLFSLDI